jgi:hypothetical protein
MFSARTGSRFLNGPAYCFSPGACLHGSLAGRIRFFFYANSTSGSRYLTVFKIKSDCTYKVDLVNDVPKNWAETILALILGRNRAHLLDHSICYII